MQHQKNGYILILTMMMMGALSAIVVFMFNRGMSVVPYLSTVVSREKAKMLARGGVEIARGLLADFNDYAPEQKNKQSSSSTGTIKSEELQENSSSEKKLSKEQTFLQNILPSLNRVQHFEFTQQRDGIDGTLDIKISCEDGKININKIFDFSSKKFLGEGIQKSDFKTIFDTFLKKVESKIKAQDLLNSCERFLKKQTVPLDDISQLLEIPEWAPFKDKLFISIQDQSQKEQNEHIALADLFTVHGHSAAIEPWLMSGSLLYVLGIETKQTADQRKKSVNEWLKNFKKNRSWPSDWNSGLKNMYQKEFNNLPKGIDSFFAAQFNPTYFSVLIVAKVDAVVQKIYVIIERVNRSHNNQIVYDSIIRKMYVL